MFILRTQRRRAFSCVSVKSFFMFFALANLFTSITSSCASGQEWLTPAERVFFSGLPAEYSANGELFQKNASFDSIPQALAKAKGSQRANIKMIMDALDIESSSRNSKELNSQTTRAVEDLRRAAILAAVSYDNPWKAAADIARDIGHSDRMKSITELQISRGQSMLEAQTVCQNAVEKILVEIGNRQTINDKVNISLRLRIGEEGVVGKLKSNESLVAPILCVRIKKTDTMKSQAQLSRLGGFF